MRKALFLFYFLIFYAITQLLWWGYILIKFEPERKGMIIGEGLIFMLIFIWGALKLKKQVKRDHEINLQQQNFLLAAEISKHRGHRHCGQARDLLHGGGLVTLRFKQA